MKLLNLLLVWLASIQIGSAQTDKISSSKQYFYVGNLLNKVGVSVQQNSKKMFNVGNDLAYYFDIFPGFKNSLFVNLKNAPTDFSKYVQFAYLLGLHDVYPRYFQYQILPKNTPPCNYVWEAVCRLLNRALCLIRK